MSNSLSLNDYAFLALETAQTPLHVGVLLKFKPPKAYKGYFTQELISSMREVPFPPPFNYVLDQKRRWLPHWRELDRFDPYYHIRMLRLPKPGNHQQLCEEVTAMHETLMDRNRPMWELYVIEGLRGGRLAIYLKLHHAIFDGASVLHAVTWLSNSTTAKAGAVWASQAPTPDLSPLGKLGKMLRSVPESMSEAQKLIKGLPSVGPFLCKRLREAAGTRNGLMAVPLSATHSPMDAFEHNERIFDYADLSLSRVKALGKRNNASVNDIMLTVCDMAILRYMEEQGTALDQPLVVSIAISLRKPGDDKVGGNQVTAALLKMGEIDASPAARLAHLQAAVKEARREMTSIPAEVASIYTLLVAAPALLGDKLGVLSKKKTPKIQNLVISNPYGLRAQKYLKGQPWRPSCRCRV